MGDEAFFVEPKGFFDRKNFLGVEQFFRYTEEFFSCLQGILCTAEEFSGSRKSFHLAQGFSWRAVECLGGAKGFSGDAEVIFGN